METQVEVKEMTPVTAAVKITTDAKVKQLLELEGAHASLDKAVLTLEKLLAKLKAKKFSARVRDEQSLKTAEAAITRALHIQEPSLLPLSFADFYGAPSWMPKDSAMYAEYRLYVDTRWFKHATSTLIADRLMHVFGLHAAVGEVSYWATGGAAQTFLQELSSSFSSGFGAEPSAAVSVAEQTLEAVVKLAVNLAREENFGSLERLLPLLELVADGVFPLGIRDDRMVLVAFA